MTDTLGFVESKARSVWRLTHSRGWFSRLLRRVLRVRPIRVVWIEQYEDGDWTGARCGGAVVQAWRFDAAGLTPVERIGEVDRSSAISSTTPVIRFWVDESAGKMVCTEWRGFRAGHGGRLTRGSDKQWVTDACVWKS